MKKILALVGTNADFSYNRILLKFIKRHFKQLADIEIYEISQLPLFSVDVPLEDQTAVWELKQKVKECDGVIFSTPEYDHGVPAALKSTVEWLSYHTKVLEHKPVMVVGVSYGRQASARSQVQMRQILVSPDCDANLMPGNEVLIGGASQSFSKDGRLIDSDMRDNLERCFTHFIEYIQVFQQASEEESKMAIKQPSIEDAYIKFPTGRMTLKQVQQIFSTIPFEIDLVDSTDHFVWYSDKPNREHVRNTASLNEPITECHPPKAVPYVQQIIDNFRDGQKDVVTRPLWMKGHRSLIQYYALRDIDGHYLGTIEFTGNVEYILNLFENGAWGDKPAGMATDDNDEADNSSDATTGASESGSVTADDSAADATTGASEN